MDSLEAQRIQKSRGIANQQHAIVRAFGQGPPAALGQRLGAVANHLPVGQKLFHERMQLECLEGHVRVEHRIRIVETSDKSNRQPRI